MNRKQYHCFQYGYSNGSFWMYQDQHMLYVSFGVQKPGDWQFQINCSTPDEASRIYDAVNREPLLVLHLKMDKSSHKLSLRDDVLLCY